MIANSMRDKFTHGWPFFEDDEIAAVERVLRSGKVNQWTGSEVRDFEKNFAGFVGARHAVALANGTVALELALRSTGISNGDEVIVTSRSFIASASTALTVGARPVFADVDPVSQNVTASTIAEVLSASSRAVVVVHLNGWPCDMDDIVALCRERNLVLIEDCAQALGAAYRGSSVGSFGDAAAWSFCQDKIMTTGGEGGMVTTDDHEIWAAAWSYKDHGKNPAKLAAGVGHTFQWVHDNVGTNWRMTEMQAAIGNVMLPKVDGWVSRRQQLAALLDNRLAGHPAIETTIPGPNVRHAYYKYYFLLSNALLSKGLTREAILARLTTAGVPAFAGICSDVYSENVFEQPVSEPLLPKPGVDELGARAVMLPLHPRLSDDVVLEAADAIRTTLDLLLADPA